jgi:hypothetical protein
LILCIIVKIIMELFNYKLIVYLKLHFDVLINGNTFEHTCLI